MKPKARSIDYFPSPVVGRERNVELSFNGLSIAEGVSTYLWKLEDEVEDSLLQEFSHRVDGAFLLGVHEFYYKGATIVSLVVFKEDDRVDTRPYKIVSSLQSPEIDIEAHLIGASLAEDERSIEGNILFHEDVFKFWKENIEKMYSRMLNESVQKAE